MASLRCVEQLISALRALEVKQNMRVWGILIASFGMWPDFTVAAVKVGASVRETWISRVGWQAKERANSDVPILLALTIKQGVDAVEEAVEHLLRVSDPLSANYARYWSAAQISQAFAPSQEAIQTVQAWLEENGVDFSDKGTSWSKAGTQIRFSLSSRQAEQLLSTEIYLYSDHWSGDFLGYEDYFIPTSVSLHVHNLLPLSMHRRPPSTDTEAERRMERRSTRGQLGRSCTEGITPECVKNLYRLPSEPTHHPNNSLGIYLPAWCGWVEEDLDDFFQRFNPLLVDERPVMQPISGGYRQLELQADPFNLEANLDFEYSMALTYPQPVSDLQVGSEQYPGNLNIMLAAFDKEYCDMLNPLFDLMPENSEDVLDCGTVEPPNVISISWAWPESMFPPEYLEAQCLEFLKLGLRGVTVLTSTGDAGPGSPPHGECSDTGAFEPSWPSSCPWITAVGGTAVITSSELTDDKRDHPVAWRNQPSTGREPLQVTEGAYRRVLGNATRSSGGGFSNQFKMPKYQRAAVQEYLDREQEHLSSISRLFNPTGRGYPDVSAVGSSVQMVSKGDLKSVFGTSASTPIFASVITRINDARLHVGKRPVGFINPVLYAHTEALNDVVNGSNAACSVDEAFRSAEGWDAVSGLGSPDYETMVDVFLTLP